MNNRSRFTLAALAALWVAAMLAQPHLPDDSGPLIALGVWCVLWLTAATTWAYNWRCAYERDATIFSKLWVKPWWGTRGKANFALQALAAFAVCLAGVVITHVG